VEPEMKTFYNDRIAQRGNQLSDDNFVDNVDDETINTVRKKKRKAACITPEAIPPPNPIYLRSRLPPPRLSS
jgi:hypothetical protein